MSPGYTLAQDRMPEALVSLRLAFHLLALPSSAGLAEVLGWGRVQAQVDELTTLQEATQAELDALLPSVLDRAFRGEL